MRYSPTKVFYLFFGFRQTKQKVPRHFLGFEPAPQATAKPAEVHVLVLGGSQGAHAINVAMMAAARLLVEASVPVVVTHQTGERDHGAVRRVYAEAGLTARVEPFLDHMVDAMRDADVVVCRAGATTLAEIAAVGRVALLVPLPGAADGHQRLNAEVFVRAGAAEVVPQASLAREQQPRARLLLGSDGPRVAARLPRCIRVLQELLAPAREPAAVAAARPEDGRRLRLRRARSLR